ncbi:MAG: rod shape-determining protein MreD [Candidatus Glassbacteria bacterium RBG_16_58_8]|uniref:Rod shape-determining protein MreD n=1 Tax=Candidatus Glassbacteria bacterium RBG_16_58_8 TaxID=1817866 RepID=A0A1F5YBR5_9BACT|nr:MAG: rod shape-determining protein MreD [Candidatus Glassbacteria bacterium RBG_16_58_8]
MIRNVFPVLFIVFLLSLQIFLHSLFGRVDSLPDFIPIVLTIAAMRWGIGGAAFLGFLTGLMEDSFSTTHLGLGALSWVVAGSLGASARGSLFGSRSLVAVILVIILKGAHDVLYYVVHLWNTPGEILPRLLLSTPLDVIVSAGLGFVTFVLLDRLLLE